MIRALKILFVVILSIMPLFLASQGTENKISYNAIREYPFDLLNVREIDTTLNNFNLNDLIFSYDDFYNSLGNIGLSHRPLLFRLDNRAGFKYGYDCFEKYLLRDDNSVVVKSVTPYTCLSYTSAPGNERIEEMLYVEHNQNFGKTVSLGANFSFINSKGFYTHQHALVANFSANMRFRTLNDRYGFILAYYHTRVDNEENGGMTDDTEFTENKVLNRKTIDVSMNDASNFIKNGGWYFCQDLYLTKRDSVHQDNKLKIYHRINYVRDRRVYQDDSPDSIFYHHLYIDQSVFDSTVIHSLYNTVALTNFDNDNHRLPLFELGADANYFKVKYNYKVNNEDGRTYNNTSIYNLVPYAKVKLALKSFSLFSEARLTFGNYNLGDYEIDATAEVNVKKFLFRARYQTTGVDVPWMYTRMQTSTAQWENSFRKTFSNKLDFEAAYKKYQLGLTYNLVNNYSYLNQSVEPQSAENPIHYFSAYLYAEVDLWKFVVAGKFIYQNVNDKEIVRVPEFMGKLKLAFRQPLFKGKLQSELGVDCVYNTAFYAEAYMPSIRSFYLQDEVLTGNYPYLNFYLKMQVKRARFFVEFVNITEGLTGYNYIGVPHYPLNDRQLKLGINWYFHD